MDIIEARRALVLIEVATYPTLKNEQSRDKIRKKYSDIANPFRFSTKNAITTSEFARKHSNGQ